MPVLSEAALDHVAALRGADARLLHVVDVGANPIEGEVSYRGLLDRGLCRVTGFEPQPDALTRLLGAKGPNETYFPDALGDGNAATLHLTQASGFTSVFAADRGVAGMLGWGKAMRAVERLPVATVRLDGIALEGPVDFLKIDVQGSELAIIANGAGTLARAVAVQTEVRFLPIYAGEPRFGALDAELDRQGFVFHDFVHLKRVGLRSPHASRLRRRADRQVVDGDALYLRGLVRPDAMTEDQLFALAILALGVFESAGVAVHALDALAGRGRINAADVGRTVDLLPERLRAEGVA